MGTCIKLLSNTFYSISYPIGKLKDFILLFFFITCYSKQGVQFPFLPIVGSFMARFAKNNTFPKNSFFKCKSTSLMLVTLVWTIFSLPIYKDKLFCTMTKEDVGIYSIVIHCCRQLCFCLIELTCYIQCYG